MLIKSRSLYVIVSQSKNACFYYFLGSVTFQVLMDGVLGSICADQSLASIILWGTGLSDKF